MRTYKVKATALFPIHIGGGQDQSLGPLDYVVKERGFYRIDMENMLDRDASFAAEFVKLVDANRIMDLRRLIAGSFDPSIKETWQWKAGTSKAFAKNYEMRLSDPRNQLLVQCLPRSGNKVYIPGSSIKGSIRTAVVDQLAEEKGYVNVADRLQAENRKNVASCVEALVLEAEFSGSGQIRPESDPFKGVKVSDAMLPENCTTIEEVMNVRKDGNALSLDMFVETVAPGTEFNLVIEIEDKAGMADVRRKIKIGDIIDNTAVFFQTELKNEETAFYEGRDAQKWIDKAFAVNDEENADNKTVIRLGRFSHLESMTFNHATLRKPRPPWDPKTKQPKKWGTTRNLVNGTIPLGALKLEIVK